MSRQKKKQQIRKHRSKRAGSSKVKGRRKEAQPMRCAWVRFQDCFAMSLRSMAD
jgi:hypothetical protein